jgi:hypothetical protein
MQAEVGAATDRLAGIGVAMKTCFVFSALALVFAVSFLGCGSSQGYNANKVTVAISPATSTVAANGKVELEATVTGLCSGCMPDIDSWGITEDASPGDSNGSSCDWYTSNGPPITPCPAGTIEEAGGSLSNSLKVTYHASATPGTYHVTAGWSAGFVEPISKQGVSVVTVTPEAP